MADLSIIGNKNLSQLPGTLALRIRNHLDVSEQFSGWRAIVAVLDGSYVISDISPYEREHSPTTKLINALGAKGMTIEQFVEYAAKAEDSKLLSFFDNVLIPAQVIEHPPEQMDILQGETVNLTVRTRGYPPPFFQWCKDEEAIDGAIYSTYELVALSKADSGSYFCAVSNSPDIQYSRPTVVNVSPACCDACRLRDATESPCPVMIIKENPQNQTVEAGGSPVFICEAWGEDLSYQWFQNDIPLGDCPKVRGSNTSILKLYNIDGDHWSGSYRCEISRDIHKMYSTLAILRYRDTGRDPRPAPRYTATDKVALLIGCADYRSDGALTAPTKDVQTLSKIFQAIGFKVVSLLNLTKAEMEAAVYEFRKLVGKGVYCVFYFCGHGFEVANQCFLVPTDAPLGCTYNKCISADYIFSTLLKEHPKICCMILDICRKHREDRAVPSLLFQREPEEGNAVICYGTSFGLSAYESKDCGILVGHLKKHLGLPIDIESVFKRLREDINNDPKVNHGNPNDSRVHKQIPELRTSLLEVERSFRDPICGTNHTAECNLRQAIWERAHQKPGSMVLDVIMTEKPGSMVLDDDVGFKVTVQLDFQQEFSNVLKIYSEVLDCGPAQKCVAYVSHVPVDVVEKAKTRFMHGESQRKLRCYTELHSIQRLRRDLKINITVTCTSPDCEKTVEEVNLQRPLVAQLELWRVREDLNHPRRAEESQDDDPEEIEDYRTSLQEELRHLNM